MPTTRPFSSSDLYGIVILVGEWQGARSPAPKIKRYEIAVEARIKHRTQLEKTKALTNKDQLRQRAGFRRHVQWKVGQRDQCYTEGEHWNNQEK